jgi:hypothetical protein
MLCNFELIWIYMINHNLFSGNLKYIWGWHWTWPVVQTPCSYAATFSLKKAAYSWSISRLHRLQTGLVSRIWVAMEGVCDPHCRNAVTTDPWLVDGDSLGAQRRHFVERVSYPNGIDSKGAGGAAAQGDPASMRSSLSCRCMEREFLASLFIMNR